MIRNSEITIKYPYGPLNSRQHHGTVHLFHKFCTARVFLFLADHEAIQFTNILLKNTAVPLRRRSKKPFGTLRAGGRPCQVPLARTGPAAPPGGSDC